MMKRKKYKTQNEAEKKRKVQKTVVAYKRKNPNNKNIYNNTFKHHTVTDLTSL